MTDVVVRLRADAARALRGGEPVAGVSELESVLARFGAELRQQHPGVCDPELQSYFTLSVATPGQAESLATALRGLAAIEAAYVQPRPSPA